MTDHACAGASCRLCDHRGVPQSQREPYVAPAGAAAMNAVGSPTGRVTSDAPETSVSAARRSNAGGHREIIHAALVQRGPLGLTSIEAAARLPATAQGGAQVSNRSASRLGELWEEGRAAVLRERGVCVLGECHGHAKPQVVHRPQAACEVHGRPSWIAL
jgi:hypothetical protein